MLYMNFCFKKRDNRELANNLHWQGHGERYASVQKAKSEKSQARDIKGAVS